MKTQKNDVVPEQFKNIPPSPEKLTEFFLEWLRTERYLAIFQETDTDVWRDFVKFCYDEDHPNNRRTALIKIIKNPKIRTDYKLRALISLIFPGWNDISGVESANYKYSVHFVTRELNDLDPDVREMFFDIVTQFSLLCEQTYHRPDEKQHDMLTCCADSVLKILKYALLPDEQSLVCDAYPVWIKDDSLYQLDRLNEFPQLVPVADRKSRWLLENSFYLDQRRLNELVKQYWMEFVRDLGFPDQGDEYSSDTITSLVGHIFFIDQCGFDAIGYLFSSGEVDAAEIESLWRIVRKSSTSGDVLVDMLVDHMRDDDIISVDFLETLKHWYSDNTCFPEWIKKQSQKTSARVKTEAEYNDRVHECDQLKIQQMQERNNELNGLLEKMKC